MATSAAATGGQRTIADALQRNQAAGNHRPFRYFHDADENDSTAMAAVMKYLRACASSGAAVVILHHPSKQEGSTGRGSSVIRGHCDLVLLHSLDKESQLITLNVDKNRNGQSRTITIRADFEQGRFHVTDSPYIINRNEEYAKLAAIIDASPGIKQNSIVEQARMQKKRVGRLLKEGRGTRWGKLPAVAITPFSITRSQVVLWFRVVLGTSRSSWQGGSAVLSPYGENHGTAPCGPPLSGHCRS